MAGGNGAQPSTFKMAGSTNIPMERTDELSSRYLRSRREHFRILVRQYYSLIGFKVIIAGGLLLLGGILVFEQQMNIGQFVAAEIVIVQIISSVEKLVYSIENIYDVLTGLEKVGSITDLELENTEEESQEPLEDLSPIEVKLKNVELKSPQWNKTILHEIDITIKAGQKIAVCGNMGAGKSSFLELLAGLFDNYTGRIFYNDIALANIRLESLRNAIGDNLRQEEIFEASLRDNITLGRPNVDKKQVHELIRVTGLIEFTDGLPRGIQTVLPSSGIGLSSSIRNRILMARSLAGNHGLLLIEDNWYDVNRETREKWIDYICMDCDHTVLIATNRDDLLQKMDRIIILENGRIVKDGTYPECKDQLPC